MGYLIDTSIWIDVERGALAPADVVSLTGGDPVYLSPVSIAELKFGAEMAKNAGLRQKRLAALERLLRKPTLKIDEVTGNIFGSLAADLSKKGRGHQFRIQDIWIAGQAIQYGVKLLTHNVADFEDVPGLEVVRMPAKD